MSRVRRQAPRSKASEPKAQKPKLPKPKAKMGRPRNRGRIMQAPKRLAAMPKPVPSTTSAEHGSADEVAEDSSNLPDAPMPSAQTNPAPVTQTPLPHGNRLIAAVEPAIYQTIEPWDPYPESLGYAPPALLLGPVVDEALAHSQASHTLDDVHDFRDTKLRILVPDMMTSFKATVRIDWTMGNTSLVAKWVVGNRGIASSKWPGLEVANVSVQLSNMTTYTFGSIPVMTFENPAIALVIAPQDFTKMFVRGHQWLGDGLTAFWGSKLPHGYPFGGVMASGQDDDPHVQGQSLNQGSSLDGYNQAIRSGLHAQTNGFGSNGYQAATGTSRRGTEFHAGFPDHQLDVPGLDADNVIFQWLR